MLAALVEDAWINGQVLYGTPRFFITLNGITNIKFGRTHDLAELEDCAIAVDATYYLLTFLENAPFHEPLLPALGGLTGIQNHIEKDLDEWAAFKVTPFF